MLMLQLRQQHLSRYGITQKQLMGIFIVNEITILILLRFSPAHFYCFIVVSMIFHYSNALAAEKLLFPFLGLSRHMNNSLIAQGSTYNAYSQAQITGGTYLQLLGSKELLGLAVCQLGVIILITNEYTMLNSQLFSVFQHLINTASSLNRACHCQMAVHLHHQPALNISTNTRIIQGPLQLGYLHQIRVNHTIAILCFWKQQPHKRRKTAQSGIG